MTTETTYTVAIKTGRCYTAVRVGLGQCTVASADGNGRICHYGQDIRAIKRAARDGAGRAYKTLRELLADEPTAERRRDLDC